MIKVEEGKSYIGIVEDNKDPKKLGRVKVRVLNVYDELDLEDIPWARPWKDLAGNHFALPEPGKVVTVVFESGNSYKPEFICSDHFNINLEKKLSQLGEVDYLTMKSLMFDHKTQIYVNESEGLKLDHKFNMINIRDTSINVNLKDNFGRINLGTANSTQRAILGDNFLNWFDDFVMILLGNQGGPFLGNLGAPVIATPALMSNLQIYQQKKIPKFLSKNVYIVDNENVSKLDRIAEGQKGDQWRSTVKKNEITTTEAVNYKATPGPTSTQFDKPSENSPTDSKTPLSPSSTSDPSKNPDKMPSTLEEANQGKPPKPDDHPDVTILLQVMSEKGYKVFTEPFKMNIVAVRNQCLVVGDKYTDDFVDFLYLLYKDDTGSWDLKQYNYSTMPGVEFKISDQWISDRPTLTKKDFWVSVKGQKSTIKDYYKIETQGNYAPNGESGLPILVPSQYIDVYFIANYRGAQAMLTHPDSVQQVWFDSDYSFPYDFKPVNFTKPSRINSAGKGDFKIGVHRGYPGGVKVGDWSEGSHCFQTANALEEFFVLCNKHKEKYGNIFSYTLITKKDWDAASRAVEIDKIDQVPQPTILPTPTTETIPGQNTTETSVINEGQLSQPASSGTASLSTGATVSVGNTWINLDKDEELLNVNGLSNIKYKYKLYPITSQHQVIRYKLSDDGKKVMMRNDGIVRQIDQTYTKDFLINEAIENASDYDSNGNRAIWIK